MFFQNELEFLGHLISSEGIKPTQSHVRVIQEAPAPQNRQELQSFLGMVTYNSKFIPALSHTLHPLHQLLRKNNQWVWKAQHQKAFVAAKQLLCEGSMLVHYDVKKPIKLFCGLRTGSIPGPCNAEWWCPTNSLCILEINRARTELCPD